MKTSLSAVRNRVNRLAERSSCKANLVNWDELVVSLQSARHEDLVRVLDEEDAPGIGTAVAIT